MKIKIKKQDAQRAAIEAIRSEFGQVHTPDGHKASMRRALLAVHALTDSNDTATRLSDALCAIMHLCDWQDVASFEAILATARAHHTAEPRYFNGCAEPVMPGSGDSRLASPASPKPEPVPSTGDEPPLVAIDWGHDEMVDVESTGSGPEEAAFIGKHLEQGRAVRRLDTGLPVIVIRGGVAEVVYGDAHIIDLDNPED